MPYVEVWVDPSDLDESDMRQRIREELEIEYDISEADKKEFLRLCCLVREAARKTHDRSLAIALSDCASRLQGLEKEFRERLYPEDKAA